MKYTKTVEALYRIIFLIGKQGIQETAEDSDTLWNPGDSLAIVWQVT